MKRGGRQSIFRQKNGFSGTFFRETIFFFGNLFFSAFFYIIINTGNRFQSINKEFDMGIFDSLKNKAAEVLKPTNKTEEIVFGK